MHTHSLLAWQYTTCAFPWLSSRPYQDRRALTSILLSNTNDSASWACTSISSGLALLVASFAQVVSASMNNDGTTQDTLGSNQLYEFVGCGAFGVALSIGCEVAQVSYMPNFIFRCSMLFAVWID